MRKKERDTDMCVKVNSQCVRTYSIVVCTNNASIRRMIVWYV